jgi:NADH-quinone oxidoreductase subunit G
MVTIYVDNKPYTVDSRQNLLHACLSLGFNLPYFCWHPALGSVGACRQCAVKQFKDENDTQGRIVMACMTPATDGTRISIHDPEAVVFRKAVIEGMMLNHPHDCPVCDEGGECHLQDMTVMTGHNYRNYRFNKRTFRNQYLGPFVQHEMNRCIQCYRCVRYYREYAGGRDLNAFSLNKGLFYGRERDGVLENEFAGNLVEICPTGVFTDKTLKRHYTRKWDLQMAPSICVHCALGCNTTTGERYGMLRRIVNRYHHEVNGYFLCDRGRFGYEFVNSGRRIREAKVRRKDKTESVTKEAALGILREFVGEDHRVIGIGSPRASLEANFALRTLVGADHFYSGMSDGESFLKAAMLSILRSGPARSPSLREIELCDAVLILGEDVTNIAPRMALSLRQSVRVRTMGMADRIHVPRWLDHAVRELVQGNKGPMFIATPAPTRLDDIATDIYRGAPDDVARMGFAVAHAIDPKAPAVEALSDPQQVFSARIASALKDAERPLVISGGGCRSLSVIHSAANVARALCNSGRRAALAFVAPECNSVGTELLAGPALSQAIKSVLEGRTDTVLILENDLYRRAPARIVDSFLKKAEHVVVLDFLETRTTAAAELLLPAAALSESEGTLVSSEGRAQRYYRAHIPDGDVRESWRWLLEVMNGSGRPQAVSWENLDDVCSEMAAVLPDLAALGQAAPPADFRISGARIPRQPHRYSGRTAILANISVHEPKPPDDPDSALSFSMEGSYSQPPAALTPFFWAPGWNSIQSANKYQKEIAGALRGGSSGVRLIEPSPLNDASYFDEIPEPFHARVDEWLLLPLQHIFGSEELSRQAQAVEELVPEPYVLLNVNDADRLGLEAGETVIVKIDGMEYRLPVRVERDLPTGIAGIPDGLTDIHGNELPVWTRIARS